MAIDTALKNQYADNILLAVQQRVTKVAGTVYQKPNCAGEVSFQDLLASSTANEKTARNQVVVNTDPDYARRKIIPRYFYKAPLVDQMDKLMLLKDPTNEIVQNNAGALARAKDTVVCNAFSETCYGGKAGTTSYSVPSAMIIAHSSVGLNMIKIRAAKKLLDQKEVDQADRSFAISAEQVEDLLAVTEVTSADYAQVKALVSGQPGTVCGFNFVQTERLPLYSAAVRNCAAYHKTGVVLGSWIDFKASIDIMPGLHFSAQVYAGQSYGATRLEEEKVVLIQCSE
jgi:hypothetical protein